MPNIDKDQPFLLTCNDITLAIDKLRPSKVDPNAINSTVIKHLGPNFNKFLTTLFNGLLIHGYSPELVSRSIFTPLLKANKRAVSDVGSYRLIASIPVFMKIFDYAMLSKYNNLLHTNVRQFGYKRGTLSNHCEPFSKRNRESLHL